MFDIHVYATERQLWRWRPGLADWQIRNWCQDCGSPNATGSVFVCVQPTFPPNDFPQSEQTDVEAEMQEADFTA